MFKKTFTLLAVLVLSSVVLADRPLDRTEILQLFQTLTEQPKKTWISSGVINATHEEYRAAKTTDPNEIDKRIAEERQKYLDNAKKPEQTIKLQQDRLEAIPFNVRYKLSNEYTMNSNVKVVFDGSRFLWQIDILARNDSLRKPAELAGNSCTGEFTLIANQKRIFAWDGSKYIMYAQPINHAIINKERGGVNGPLTAGLIPWGYGQYSFAGLSAASSTAIETESAGQKQIQLNLITGDMQETIVLDPAKNYALKSYSGRTANTSLSLYNYGSYQQVAGKWCPGSIVMDKFDTTSQPQKLLARDIWEFTSVSDAVPADGFKVSYELDAFIEDYCYDGGPLKYRYSPPQLPVAKGIDTGELLKEHLAFVSGSSKEVQNCATAALKYTAGRFGRDITVKDVSAMLGNRNLVSLSSLQQAAEKLGLYSQAVKTDIESLKALKNCQVILHLPAVRHFVVLGSADDKFVRLIDLAGRNFYYRRPINCFSSEWDGIALIMSDNTTAIKGRFAKMDRSSLEKIVGAEYCEECNVLLQGYSDFPCDSVGGTCGGHVVYYQRWGCGTAEEEGDCSTDSLFEIAEDSCGWDPDPPFGCIGDGNWHFTYIDACG